MGIQTYCQVIGRSNLQRHIRKINILCPPFRTAPASRDVGCVYVGHVVMFTSCHVVMFTRRHSLSRTDRMAKGSL